MTQPPAPLARSARITGPERLRIQADLVQRYADGESIRSMATQLGRSYGWVQGLLKQAGVELRGRGGATRGAAGAERAWVSSGRRGPRPAVGQDTAVEPAADSPAAEDSPVVGDAAAATPPAEAIEVVVDEAPVADHVSVSRRSGKREKASRAGKSDKHEKASRAGKSDKPEKPAKAGKAGKKKAVVTPKAKHAKEKARKHLEQLAAAAPVHSQAEAVESSAPKRGKLAQQVTEVLGRTAHPTDGAANPKGSKEAGGAKDGAQRKGSKVKGSKAKESKVRESKVKGSKTKDAKAGKAIKAKKDKKKSKK